MSESFDEQFNRLRQMCDPGQQTWDLSPKDVAAIAMAVQIIDRVLDWETDGRKPFTNPSASGMGITKQ